MYALQPRGSTRRVGLSYASICAERAPRVLSRAGAITPAAPKTLRRRFMRSRPAFCSAASSLSAIRSAGISFSNFSGKGARDLPVLGGAVVSTPLDLAETCARMLTPRNFVYHRYLLSQMKREALATGAVLSATQRATIAKARNVFEFDDLFVAPLFGYRDAEDYYQANSARAFLSRLAVPTLVVHALDDPWIPRSCYDAVDWARLRTIETALSPHGGHLGFHGVGSPIPWHDRVVLAWLRGRFAEERD